MASTRMVRAVIRFSRIHCAASWRSVRSLAYVIASSGWPNCSPLRHFTSQNTSVTPRSDRSAATMSISPDEQRQLRASTARPCRSSSAQARSSPRRPTSCRDSVRTISHLRREGCGRRAPDRPGWPKPVETAARAVVDSATRTP